MNYTNETEYSVNTEKLTTILTDMHYLLVEHNSQPMAIEETPEQRDIRMYAESRSVWPAFYSTDRK